jgi:dTDP-4-amino-4,6-dideoxygalactose transaminase
LAAAGNVPVIEDAAHAPLSFLNGRMAGDFGAASFYSFASTKYWPAGGGGLAVVHDPDLALSMARQTEELPSPTSVAEFGSLMLQAAKSTIFRSDLYGVFGRPIRRWAEAWALLEPRLEMIAIQRSHATVALRQAERFPERVEWQRANSLRLLSRLGNAEGVVLPQEPRGARYNYHLFPILLRDSNERAAVVEGMWKQFVDTSTIYSGAVDVCRNFGYRNGCPVAESVASRLLTLPNYAGLGDAEIDIVAQAFLSSLKAWRTAQPGYPLVCLGVRAPADKVQPDRLLTRGGSEPSLNCPRTPPPPIR